MKKFSNVAALIAAGALLFGGLFFSCSSDGLPPEIGFESKTKTIENGSAATLNVTGTSVSSSDEKVAKAEIDGTDIKITSVWVGKATITVTDGTDDVTIPVYVKASGDIELGTATKSSASNNGGSVSQGTPITFDCTLATSEMGAALSALEKKAAVTAGTYDGVTLAGTVTRTNSDTLSIELGKAGAGTASFSVKSGASIVFTFASTGGTNASDYKIAGAGTDKTGSIDGSTFTEVSTTATSDGTVTISSDGGTNTTRGGRIQKITVTYN